MVLDKLGISLRGTFQKIAKAVFVDEKLINELVKEIQKSLLQADVNVRLVFELTNTIKKRIKKEDAPVGITKKEHLINVVYEELVNLLGGDKKELAIKGKKPFKLMLVGLFGSGKTTTAGKLARYYSKRGHKTALLGLDVWRPAAMQQLEQVAKQAKIPVYINKEEKDPIKIYAGFEKELGKYDLIIIDTAGRDALNEELIQELNTLASVIKPDEVFLVLSADIGQAAQTQAEKFHQTCNITGVIATKMDGTAKAGGALTACAVTKAPIVFMGVGEKIGELEQFNPVGFIERLLGMGDLEALLEKAQTAITEEEAQDLGKKLLKGEFNLIDLYEQMRAMKKMGPISKIAQMIPGFSQFKIPDELLEVQESKLTKWKYIMDSCTKEELEEPEKISASRAERIAKGSGTDATEIRGLLKQYKQSKKLLKMMKGGSPDKLMSKMQKGKFKGLNKRMWKSPAGQ